MTRKVGAAVSLIALTAVSAGAVAATSDRGATAAQKKPIRYEAQDLYIETNATDGDAGLSTRRTGRRSGSATRGGGSSWT